MSRPSTSSKALKVCLVSPLPPPYGGIGHWTKMICSYAAGSEVSLHVVDVSPRWRRIDDLRIWKRVVFGGMMMLWHVAQVLWHLLNGCRVVHIATPGQLSIFRDMAIILAAKAFRVRTLYHIRFGRVPEIADQGTNEWRQMARVMKWSYQVIAIDGKTLAAIHRHLPEVDVCQLPNCVDIDGLPTAMPRTEKTRTVLCIGWVIPTKGIEELVRAWSDLKPDGWALKLVGPGDVKYQSRLMDFYQPENVEFLGEKDHNDAMGMLASASIFILPSYTEGFPNVIAEAMAIGTPIIATSVGAIPEMLAGGCGRLIQPRDVNAIKEALVELMMDDGLCDFMARNALIRVRSEYALPMVFDRLAALWRAAARKSCLRPEDAERALEQERVGADR